MKTHNLSVSNTEIIPVVVNKNGANIQIPTKFLKQMGLSGKQKDMFITLTDGVLQITVGEPKVVIPVFTTQTTFIPQ